ncbi:TIGR03084 family metal-binding protein [Amycolatopsis jejuensis]|uniref:TIGR03084 family metal-binding protein n=1 Tax=Amycolatopsis jejuensis TaxID=330084 RepID=UPI000A01D86B
MAVTMPVLLDDLAAETETVRELVEDLPETGWQAGTPSPGWSIADQISHLAFFDDQARLALVDPDAFAAGRATIEEHGIDPDQIAGRYRSWRGSELLSWFTSGRAELISAFTGADPGSRVPWFSQEMSIGSCATARLMETWAHGVDIADTLGVPIRATERLRHVAHLGVGARKFSFLINGRPAPDTPVRVELTGPAGPWTWGPPDAPGRVTGPALDFCFAVTQRRHLADLDLVLTGPGAAEWMSLAQAFAGEPGAGRQPTMHFVPEAGSSPSCATTSRASTSPTTTTSSASPSTIPAVPSTPSTTCSTPT